MIYVIGLGPGGEDQMTPRALAALDRKPQALEPDHVMTEKREKILAELSAFNPENQKE